MTPEVFDRAQQLLSFLKETDLFKASHWTHKQFKDDRQKREMMADITKKEEEVRLDRISGSGL